MKHGPLETYTFSRALRLMRYCDKKMRCVHWCEDVYAYVKGDEFRIWEDDKLGEIQSISSYEIIGSWVEVE